MQTLQSFFGNWTTQLRKGVLELAVVNKGTIHPLLSRLKKEGPRGAYL